MTSTESYSTDLLRKWIFTLVGLEKIWIETLLTSSLIQNKWLGFPQILKKKITAGEGRNKYTTETGGWEKLGS